MAEYPTVPTTRDDLLIEALRHANRVSIMLNDLFSAMGDHRFDDMDELLRRRFSDCSGLHLFIAASNLRIELPEDLRDEPDEET